MMIIWQAHGPYGSLINRKAKKNVKVWYVNFLAHTISYDVRLNEASRNTSKELVLIISSCPNYVNSYPG